MADNRSLLHTGQVSSHNNNAAAAKIAMDDFDGMVSGHMQMLFPASGHWNFFWIPKEGDHVVMERSPNGIQEGYIVGKPYTANNMPQGGDDGLFLMVSSDGKNVIKLDAIKGTMDIVCDQKTVLKTKDIDIEVAGNANIKVDGDTSVKVDGNVAVEAGADAEVKAGGNVKVEAAGDADLKGVNVTVDASAMLTLKTGDAAPWMPNIMPQCPLGPVHGGKTAGIIKLCGK